MLLKEAKEKAFHVWYLVLLEMLFGAYSGQHQDVGRPDGPGTQDDLLVAADDKLAAIAKNLNS